MNIYILGYMGCGKSKVAKQLASYSHRNYVDLDSCFEKKFGKINDFFRQKGEPAFRQVERELLLESQNYENSIIALGGGTPCFENNMDWILQHGFSVYLKMNELALLQRLRFATVQRPMLENLSETELLEFIYNHLKERSPYYERADLSWSGINVHIADLWDKIEEKMKLSGKENNGKIQLSSVKQ